MTSCFVDSRSV